MFYKAVNISKKNLPKFEDENINHRFFTSKIITDFSLTLTDSVNKILTEINTKAKDFQKHCVLTKAHFRNTTFTTAKRLRSRIFNTFEIWFGFKILCFSVYILNIFLFSTQNSPSLNPILIVNFLSFYFRTVEFIGLSIADKDFTSLNIKKYIKGRV